MAGRVRTKLTRVNFNHAARIFKEQIKIARSGSALTLRLVTGNWGRVLGRGIKVLFYEYKLILSFQSDSLFCLFLASPLCLLDTQETHRHTHAEQKRTVRCRILAPCSQFQNALLSPEAEVKRYSHRTHLRGRREGEMGYTLYLSLSFCTRATKQKKSSEAIHLPHTSLLRITAPMAL